MRVSDLRGYGEQFTFVLAPDPFKVRLPAQLYASAGYTIQSSRRQFRGFDGAGFGDPRVTRVGAESARRAARDRSLRWVSTRETGTRHALLAHPVGIAVHAHRAGRRQRRRPRRRSRVHSRSRARDGSDARHPAPVAADVELRHGSRVLARRTSGRSWRATVPRSVDAIAQRAVAAADSRASSSHA